MSDSLEQRLSKISNPDSVRSDLVKALNSRNYYIPRLNWINIPYLKLDLVEAITNYFKKYLFYSDSRFKDNIYSSINKEELKHVNWGIVCLKKRVPDEIMCSLSNWEKTMFFAGVWFDKNTDFSSEPDLHSLVRRYIKKGYDGIHEMHMIKYNTGKYARPLKIPESQNFWKERMANKNADIQHIINLLEKEKQMKEQLKENPYELGERIGIMLDSCSEEKRRKLTTYFGADALGDYAVD